MGKRLAAAAAAAITVLAVGGLASSNPASAGKGFQVDVFVEVAAPDAAAVIDGLTIEIFLEAGGDAIRDCFPEVEPLVYDDGITAGADVPGCSVGTLGSYQIGVLNAPAGAYTSATCGTDEFQQPGERIDAGTPTFTITEFTESAWCIIDIVQPAVLIDKIVDGGDAAPGDFTLEVYGGPETLTATDPSDALCEPFGPTSSCAAVLLPYGDYQLGEEPAPGYLPSNVWCQEYFPFRPSEVFPTDIGTFTLGSLDQEQAPFAYCQVTNQPFEGDLVVRKTVVNDSGGSATANQFTAEVYRDGSLVQSGVCAADGGCLDLTLPVGEYRIGESGPSGYAASVSCTVTRGPDYGIGTTPPTSIVQDREAIAGDAALAEVEPFGEVTCLITNDDIATTTTTTLAPTTTDAGGQPAVPTTLAPQLPATGSSDVNVALTVVALGLLTVGGSLLALRRR